VTLVVPGNASPERIAILHALGAELLLSDALEGSDGAIRMAREMAAEQPGKYWYANQYDNAANWQSHYQSTGPEILAQSQGRITHFVAGIGTSGTLMGTGRYMKHMNPSIQVIGFQPDDAFHGLEGLKHIPTAIKPGIFDAKVPDRTLEVETEAAHEMVRRLAREEGLFVGISSGAAAEAALRVARELKEGTVVTVFPDAGYKYLSDKALWSGT
jgi:cysteine synthase B